MGLCPVLVTYCCSRRVHVSNLASTKLSTKLRESFCTLSFSDLFLEFAKLWDLFAQCIVQRGRQDEWYLFWSRSVNGGHFLEQTHDKRHVSGLDIADTANAADETGSPRLNILFLGQTFRLGADITI